jgi:RHS repeat-associated protein
MQLASSARIPDGLLAAMRLGGEKPHQGLPGRNPALYQGPTVCNSTTALGLQAAAVLNRIGSCSTGKERDTESGNDYFGARYYASSMGRFMSPDWSAKMEPVPYAKLDYPQTLNLYAYVGNNPLSSVDSDGHEIDLNGNDKQKAEEERRLAANAPKTDKNGVKESSLFKETTDKNGKTTMTLDKDAAAKYDGKHSQGFNDLLTVINSKDVVGVNLMDNSVKGCGCDTNYGQQDSPGHYSVFIAQYQTAADKYAPFVNGNPFSVIAGHEVLGHARFWMLGVKDWHRDGPGSPTFQYENRVLRPEQHLGPRLDWEP